VARQALVGLLRKKKGDTHFLKQTWIDACKTSPNRLVQGFIAEQIAISAILNDGIVLGDRHFKPKENYVFSTPSPISQASGSCIQYVPGPFNFRKVDSIVRNLDTKSKTPKKAKHGKKPKAIEEEKLMATCIANQMTFQSIAKHKHSLEFFSSDYKTWEFGLDGFTMEWIFVWIVPSNVRNAATTYPIQNNTYKCSFQEYVLSFGDVYKPLEFI
jgi:hypothetical protein